MAARKVGRNDRCWCGSGIKYKRCHLNRDKEARAQPWEAEKALRQAFGAKTCSVPQELKRECDGDIVRAHTVPRSGSLKKIEREGHVYAFVPSFKSLTRNKGALLPELLGINKASTFTGFCAHHDNSLFAPLEKGNFNGTAEQCFLLAYRALAKEIFAKTAAASLSQVTRNADRGRPVEEQLEIQTLSALWETGTAAGLRDNDYHKAEYDNVLLSRDYERVRAYIVDLDTPPPVMCSGGFFPERDFDGTVLQDIADLKQEAKLLTVSSFANGDAGVVAFAWLGQSDTVCEPFIRSLDSIDNEHLTSALLRLFFEYFENVFIQPSWWEGLDPQLQKYLVKRMSIAEQMFGAEPSGDIREDGVEFVSWVIRSRRALTS
jgi:hypothetical protein